MSIRHDARQAAYLVTVGAETRRSTYERGDAVSKREAWQFACELEAELTATARAAELAAANAEIAAAVAGFEPDAEEQAEFFAWVAELEAEAAAVSYTLPAEGLVRAALAEIRATAEAAGDTRNAAALGRAQGLLDAGRYGEVAEAEGGALVVPSQRAGEGPYTVGDRGCPCPSGRWGRPCAHSALCEGVALAREWAAAELDDAATYGRMAA
ncbi:MAG: hypothetical protein KBA95_16190 [Acidobacteria bacterium]|nr:hypothetical protein [Acidobacteriota bacterium]